jgi:hypothetical protein
MAEVDFERPIGLSPHFSVHVVDDRQVLLLSEQRSFRLTGRLRTLGGAPSHGTHGKPDPHGPNGRAPADRLRQALQNLLEGLRHLVPCGRRGSDRAWADAG